LERVDWGDIDYLISSKSIEDLPLYVSITRQDEKRNELFKINDGHITQIKEGISSDTRCALIYNNPNLILYAEEI